MRTTLALVLAACSSSGPAGPGSVTVWNGRGGGIFERGNDIAIPNARLALPADIDLDGRVDIIAIDGGGVTPVRIARDGHLERGDDWRIDEYARGAAVGDLDGDGKPDLVLATARALLVYKGDGRGGFTETARYEGGLGTSVAIADLDSNGTADLVTVADTNAVSAYLNDGTGRFEGPHDSPTGSGPYALTVADVNGDTRPDVITANASYAIFRDPPSASVLLGTGAGTFSRSFELQLSAVPHCVAVGDLDRDGHLDVVIPDDKIYGLIGDGSGRFRVTTVWPVAVSKVVLADVTDDGMLDVLAIDDDLVRVLVPAPAQVFTSAFAYKHDEPLADIAVADLDADGLLDFVAVAGDVNL